MGLGGKSSHLRSLSRICGQLSSHLRTFLRICEDSRNVRIFANAMDFSHLRALHLRSPGRICDICKMDEPKSVTEALSNPGKDEWMKAVKEELESMKTNKVWDLISLPPGCGAIGNKWVLKVKRKADGSIERYKARLVAKGFTQEAGIDYEEIF
ncbi:PREDICTED: uncharacterized protein LOC109226026 [Nicotiana attenuata]|uniref:uncharacterized protein LOC109226026 n=1 Tax=Nicotiana attenuata TaxID=49451 RepID=UPI0009045D4E|nr:PREDICTED: uncharacterized protein LOC109226026 [Nicotiana attenuata]